MPIIRLITQIHAPIERVFDLARSIDLHMESMSGYDETAVGGVTAGLIGMGETVTWNARHFGIRWHLTSEITGYDRPRWFRDSQLRGPFRRFDHDHFLEERDGVTTLTDIFDFNSPLGPIGRVVDALIMKRHLTRLLEDRNRHLKRAAEEAG